MKIPVNPSWICCLIILLAIVPYRAVAEDEMGEDDPYQRSWAIIQLVTAFLPAGAFFCAVFFLVALNGASERLSSFNLYLMFIIIPDALLNGIVAISLFWEGANEGTYDSKLCKARNALSFFYYHTNLYLNAVLAREIYILVVNSYRRLRTRPPTKRKVCVQIAAVYAFSAVVTAWYVLDVRWSPYKIEDMTYCVTEVGSPTDDPVFTEWTATIVGMVVIGPPFAYVFWVGYIIWRRNLLPIQGKTRSVALYFFRIVMVFICFYVPGLSLALIYMNIPTRHRTARFWVLWFFTTLIPLQCLVTLRLAMEKDDVNKAVKEGSSRIFRMTSSQDSLPMSSQDWAADDVHEETKMPSESRNAIGETSRFSSQDASQYKSEKIQEIDSQSKTEMMNDDRRSSPQTIQRTIPEGSDVNMISEDLFLPIDL